MKLSALEHQNLVLLEQASEEKKLTNTQAEINELQRKLSNEQEKSQMQIKALEEQIQRLKDHPVMDEKNKGKVLSVAKSV